jgi:Adenylate and Guanylate cyclase catalytic domain
LGKGDLHDQKYSSLQRIYKLRAINDNKDDTNRGIINDTYTILLYPTQEMESMFLTSHPLVFAITIVGIFVFTVIIFALYNIAIQRRQNKVMSSLQVTSKVILSLFPHNVLDRLIKEAEFTTNDNAITISHSTNRIKDTLTGQTEKRKIQSFLESNNDGNIYNIFKSKPIADLYPNTTVMYADIAGFTAWSSVREPSQVFTLLESLFRQYDALAKRRHVFKVETIGDCYVAVAGVPRPRSDHAVAMARFARDCVLSMNVLSKKLEIQLGPDTSGTYCIVR